jgi:hypothetical protein
MSYANVDYNKAKIAAYVVVAGFMAIMVVFGIRSASGPQLSQGDRQASLTCPVCQGSGQGKQPGTRCQACLGAKKLKAVVPGPHHPVDVRGTVRNLAAFKDRTEADAAAARDAAEQKVSLTPVQGALSNASIVFEGSAGRTDFTSKATGKFWGTILPGEYRLTVTAPGFTKQQQDITVKPRRKPIWPDVAGIPPDTSETLQLDFFLSPDG